MKAGPESRDSLISRIEGVGRVRKETARALFVDLWYVPGLCVIK